MKTCLLIPAMVIIVSCNSSTDKKGEGNNPVQKTTEINSEKKEIDDNQLKQNRDYSPLFNREEKDCDVISTDEMASILTLEQNQISANNQIAGYCRFELMLKDGSKTTLTIHLLEWGKKSIQQEINSYKEMEKDFGKDNSEGIVLISDTQDTNFCIRSNRGSLYMFNPNYDTAIEIKFGSIIEAANKKITYTDEQKKERLDNAVAVANFLLKKYKN